MQYNKQQEIFLNYSSLDETSHYHDAGNHGFFSILTKKTPESVLKQHSYRLSEMETVLGLLDPSLDSYVSQAEFLKPNRRVVNLLRLSLSYIDLDIYNSSEFSHLQNYAPESVAEFLKTACIDEGILPPSIIIFSGRGYYLKWFYTNPIPRATLPRWNALQRELVLRLSKYGADAAAKDASRILRIVTSVNSKSGQIVRVVGATYEQDKIKSYGFDQLADETLPFTREEIHQLREERAKKKSLRVIKGNKQSGLKGFSGRRLAWDRLEDLRKLYILRGSESKEGERMLFLFWQINFLLLSGATNANEMYLEASELAKSIDPNWGYKSEELSTLYDKAKDYQAGRSITFNNKQYPSLYTPKNQNLIDIFNITSDEQKKLSTLIGKAESLERKRKRQELRRRARGGVTRAEYLANSTTMQKPWEKLGVSRSKWYEMGKPAVPVDTK